MWSYSDSTGLGCEHKRKKSKKIKLYSILNFIFGIQFIQTFCIKHNNGIIIRVKFIFLTFYLL